MRKWASTAWSRPPLRRTQSLIVAPIRLCTVLVMKRLPAVLLFVSLFFGAASPLFAAAPLDLPDGLYAEIATPRGTLVAELFHSQAPLTVTNFVGLAEGTLGPEPRKPFYNGLTFHRVVPGFVIQAGDPLGTGEGGPGYEFPDEFVRGLRHDSAGVLSMANAGPDTNGSQFFITLAQVNRLNYLHSVFGRVVRGREFLFRIRAGDPMTSVTIHRIGPAAEAFRADADTFAALMAQSPRAAPPHFEDPDGVLPSDPPRAKLFALQLANLERATGLKLYARVFATFSPATPAQRPGNFTVALAKKLRLPSDAVLAIHFADTNQWGLWIGDDRLPEFMGRPGTVREFTRGGALHEAKQALLADAARQAETAIAEATAAAPPDQPLTAAQKTKLHVDAVLDALILKFDR